MRPLWDFSRGLLFLILLLLVSSMAFAAIPLAYYPADFPFVFPLAVSSESALNRCLAERDSIQRSVLTLSGLQLTMQGYNKAQLDKALTDVANYQPYYCVKISTQNKYVLCVLANGLAVACLPNYGFFGEFPYEEPIIHMSRVPEILLYGFILLYFFIGMAGWHRTFTIK